MVLDTNTQCGTGTLLATLEECRSAKTVLYPRAAAAVKTESNANAPKGCSRYKGGFLVTLTLTLALTLTLTLTLKLTLTLTLTPNPGTLCEKFLHALTPRPYLDASSPPYTHTHTHTHTSPAQYGGELMLDKKRPP